MSHLRSRSDAGASAVEYGLIVGGVVVAFLIAAIGLQTALAGVFGHALSSVEQGPDPAVPSTPLYRVSASPNP